MSIAEKLQTIAENEPKVYDAGYTKGVKEATDWGYNEGFNDGKYKGLEEGYAIGRQDGYGIGKQEGYEAGKQAEYDAFWDVLQNYGQPATYKCAFAYGVFKDEIYNPKYPIVARYSDAQSAQDIFLYSPITDTKVDIDVTGPTGCARCFSNATKLVTIRKIIVVEKNTYQDTFVNCTSLENITFEGVIGNSINLQYSPLSRQSIENIISVLSAIATGKTLTLKKTAKENAFTDEEWQTLIATKSNWTISLI